MFKKTNLEIQIEGIAYQLKRIGDILEGVLESTDPVRPVFSLDQLPEERDKERAFYTDERKDIIKEQLARLGKEYKEK